MRNQEIFVSLDIGTTSIKVVVAEYINGNINIIGVGNEKSRGLSRGVIVDIDDTVNSIQRAISQAERKANVKINEVIVGVPSNQIMVEDCHGMIAVASDNREITALDVENVINAAKVRSVPPEREIISIIPEEFIVDGFNGIKDPRGMIGVRLELYARLITGPRTIIHNIRRCVQKAGLSISELVVQPEAIASVALSADEREFGTVVVDMGGGQSSASIMYDGQMKYSFVDQEGGDFVTKDISVILNTSLDSAERIKREYGFAIASQTTDDEYFPVETVGKKEPVRVDEHYLAEIIEARLVQIFETLYEELNRVDGLDLPGGYVLTGGAVSLPGVLDLAKRYFGSKVRLFIPEEMGMRNPIYTTSLGMIEYAANLDDVHRIAQGTFAVPAQAAPRHSMSPQGGQSRPAPSSGRNQGQAARGQQSGDLFGGQRRQPANETNQMANDQRTMPDNMPSSNQQEDYQQYNSFDDDYRYEDAAYYDDYSQDDEANNYSEPVTDQSNGNGITAKVRDFFQTFFD